MLLFSSPLYYWLLGFNQHKYCPHFLSVGDRHCCLFVLCWAVCHAPQPQTVGWWSRNHRDGSEKSSAAWHSLHHNLSSCHGLPLISLWFSLHTPYGLTCFLPQPFLLRGDMHAFWIFTQPRKINERISLKSMYIQLVSSSHVANYVCGPPPAAAPLISSDMS